MAAQWWAQANEEEIRQNKEQEELFVFGYACKVFRDDDKAAYIDKGLHLIPWMSDDRLMIDRYDGRGHLYDLSSFDASNLKNTVQTPLTEDEEQIEKLCDEERYLELNTDTAEKNMYEEEEWKRYYESLSEGYNAVGFSYDYSQQMAEQQAQIKQEVEEEKPFVVAPELHVPPDILVPETEKQNAIIEKTAKFIAEHGAQMEIIMKTKQSSNPLFEFLHFENALNPYYKHVVKMIKSGKYKPKSAETEENQDDSYEEEQSDGYLHPSLMMNRASPTPDFKPVKMPPVAIHDTSYGQLIRSFKKSNKQHEKSSGEGSAERQTQKEMPAIQPPPLPLYVAQPEYGPSHSNLPLPPGLEPVTLPSAHEPPPPGTDMEGNIYLSKNSPASEDSSSRDSPVIPGAPQIIPPPPDIQPVIDRMAMYVAKNGVEFEIVVKSKNDPRFAFLEPYHVHYPYYNFKKNIHVTETAKEKKRLEKERPKGVSFSIKGKPREQESTQLEKRQVFDNDSSDEDGERERLYRSDISGTSTPVDSDGMVSSENRLERAELMERLERKQAEERLKDRMAAAAREKLVQASKEKQIQAERKRKAAMFINMLKSTNVGASNSASEDTRDLEDSGPHGSVDTPGGSRSHTPNIQEDDRLSDFSERSAKSAKKSRDRGSSPSSRSRRSPSPARRSRSPRRRGASPTTYNRIRRSSSRSPTRKIAPRPISPRRRERSRSPRYRNSPSVSPSRSRPRKRSRSPTPSRSSRKERKGSPIHRKSKKEKKEKKSRSPSSKSKWSSSMIDLTTSSPTYDVMKPEGPVSQSSTDINNKADSYSYNAMADLPPLPDCLPPEPTTDSRAPLPPLPPPPPDSDSNSCGLPSDSKSDDSQKSVSKYMLNRVRALLKASRKAVLDEEGYDDP